MKKHEFQHKVLPIVQQWNSQDQVIFIIRVHFQKIQHQHVEYLRPLTAFEGKLLSAELVVT